jgi:hemolysin activation/secretion protein
VVEGVTAKQKRKILRYLNKVVGQRPLKSKNLERYLLLVDDLSGVKLKTFMQPSTENGGAATLTVKPQIERFNVWSSADSRGTEFVGPYNLALGGTLHAPNVLGQSISGQVATTPPNTEELQYVSLSFAQEVGYEGTSVTVSASGMRSEPGQELRQLELESEALNFDMAIRLKPYRSRDANVYISLAGSIKEAETKALDSVLSQDRARQVKFGLDFQGIDNFLGANSFSFAASQGIDAMGSTPEGSALQSRFDADPEATWFNVGFTRVQSLAKWRPGFDLKASVAAQYAFEPLSAAREFSIGGMANASAFDSSEINGDNGLSGRLEVRYATSLGAIDRGVSEGWRGFAVQAYAFGDGGQVWQTRVGDQERDNGQTDDMIASAGAGLRFNLGPYTSATVEVAKPFLNVVASEGNKDPRVFFSFTNRF